MPDSQAAPLPAPPGAVSSHDRVIDDMIDKFGPFSTFEVMRSLKARKEHGLNEYSTILHKDNGRNHVLDAFEETQDLAVYLRSEMDLNPSFAEQFSTEYGQVLSLLMALQRELLSKAVKNG